jgi:acyl-coenzyme A thioesterase PaaI-like protein
MPQNVGCSEISRRETMNPLLKGIPHVFRALASNLIPHLDPGMLMKVWRKLELIPGGKIVFGEILSKFVPYTGTVSPTVMELSPGASLVVMNDRLGVRNHLRSVHAMALANIGECASGLALLAKLPSTHQGILVEFHVEYLKKARGTLTARGSVLEWTDVEISPDQIAVALAEIRNGDSDLVAICRSEWKVSPKNRVPGAASDTTTSVEGKSTVRKRRSQGNQNQRQRSKL